MSMRAYPHPQAAGRRRPAQPLARGAGRPWLAARLARGLGRLIWRRPLDCLASGTMLAFSVAIVVNALGLQHGDHPAPIFRPGGEDPAPAAPLPRPAAAATPSRSVAGSIDPAPTASVAGDAVGALSADELVRVIQDELKRRGLYAGDVDGRMGPKTAAAIRDGERLFAMEITGEPSLELFQALRTPSSITAKPGDPRITGLQKALDAMGYGPIRIDGRMGAETQSAIMKFELHHKMPPTGEVSAALLREVEKAFGKPLP